MEKKTGLSIVQLLDKIIKKYPKTIPFFFKPKSRVSITKVPIEKIRCQVKPFSEILGFSGKPIKKFPPCKFYAIYLSNPEEAYNCFFEWYYNIWFDLKAWEISKDEGGLRNGSLEALIRNLHKEAGVILEYLGDAKHYLVKIAIQSKVKHYFNLFDSIRENGFNRSLRPPIKCTCIDNLYYLKGGHHRVSVLYNLKFKNVDLKIV